MNFPNHRLLQNSVIFHVRENSNKKNTFEAATLTQSQKLKNNFFPYFFFQYFMLTKEMGNLSTVINKYIRFY